MWYCSRELDAALCEALLGGGSCAAQINGPGRSFDHFNFKAQVLGVFGGIAHAIVEGQACERELADAAFFQIAAKACGRLVIVLKKGRVGINRLAEALADDEFGLWHIQGVVKRGPV